ELYGSAGGAPRKPAAEPEPEPPRAVTSPSGPDPLEVKEPDVVDEPAAAAPEATAGEVADAEADADGEGAQLIALNMALNGQSRAETDRYLAENFDLADRERLLDEVYSSIEG
ncbi:MAG: hypothetical protein ACR2ND_04685, partial [Solirubrobacteraceae bacterium]